MRTMLVLALCLTPGLLADEPPPIDPNFPPLIPPIVPSTNPVSLLPPNFDWNTLVPTSLTDLSTAMLQPGAFQAQVGTKYITPARYIGTVQNQGVLLLPYACFQDIGLGNPNAIQAWYCVWQLTMPAAFAPFFAALQPGDHVMIVYELSNAQMELVLHAIALNNAP